MVYSLQRRGVVKFSPGLHGLAKPLLCRQTQGSAATRNGPFRPSSANPYFDAGV